MKERSLSRSQLILCLTTIFLWVGFVQHLSFANTEKSLYDRLGGYDGISAVVDVFLTRVWDDPVVGRFFVGMETDTRDQLRQKNRNLLFFNTGGPARRSIDH